jgi:hypothetical protein
MDYRRILREAELEEFREKQFDQILREADKIDTSKLPIINIEVNDEEIAYFTAIRSATTNDEKKFELEKLKEYYRDIFTRNFENKHIIHSKTGIKISLYSKGINHCLNENKNYYLWSAIKYLKPILENAYHTTEDSQHKHKSKTTRGDTVHIFLCNGNYITLKKEGQSEIEEKRQTHTLRISAITFKNNKHINFHHIKKFNENQDRLCVELESIDFI